MDLVTPEFSLVIWMTISFGALVFILGKFAWKPILKSLKDREESIDSALKSAEEAKAQMAQMKSDNEALLHEARTERESILKEAKQMKEQIITEAKKSAEIEGAKLIERANQEIMKSKNAAIEELKSQIAGFSIELTEKLLNKELASTDEQKRLIDNHIKDLEVKQTASQN
ncbi:MAG: F0F1 ATP synthase subunit B [Bacteroidia bacterium]|nr:F0F1 ATP synthase subunit B [Bacteroidia bacterium]MCO5253031.1 F0F1 ATP synthase subunit B [Bacteroidota bacterium]MCZ2131019.1 F0F1 ATP synthase subunit B [Bacteroidia bacterium]